jgi:hypothetical protein
MKKIIFFLLFINFCFSQNERLSISKIDSITSKPKYVQIQAEGNAKRENGQLDFIFVTTYFNPKDSISKKIIKGEFFEEEKQVNDYTIGYKYSYYYYDDKPFYLKLIIYKVLPNSTERDTITIELDKKELKSNREIENKFKLKLRKRIKTINKALLHYHYPNEN